MALVDIPRRILSTDEAAAAVEAAVKARLVESYTALVDATDIAVETLINIALYGRREDARVQAAKEILDRSGLTPEIRVAIDTNGSERDTRIAALRLRLDAMRTSLTTPLELEQPETA
ncbi:MAG TPA: hypothetical protein VFP09_04470 [Desertimonas sp.]|nr:hypothetical protein [Desertimonas sp.]